MHWLGLASQLKTFPDNEIRRGQYAMKLKAVAREADEIRWPKSSNHLPVLTWDEFQEACKTRQLMVISGYIHDVSTFIDEHPGGRALIKTRLGRDATNAFYGGYCASFSHARLVLPIGSSAVLTLFGPPCRRPLERRQQRPRAVPRRRHRGWLRGRAPQALLQAHRGPQGVGRRWRRRQERRPPRRRQELDPHDRHQGRPAAQVGAARRRRLGADVQERALDGRPRPRHPRVAVPLVLVVLPRHAPPRSCSSCSPPSFLLTST